MFAKVIVDIASSNVDKIFDYKMEDPIEVGYRVLVPFGNRKIEGYIIGVSEISSIDESKIKPIIAKLDEFPVLTKEQLRLAEFMKKRFHIGTADAIRLFLPPELRSGKVKEIFKATLSLLVNIEELDLYIQNLRKNAIKTKELCEHLKGANNQVLYKTDLIKKFGTSSVKKLENDNIIKISFVEVKRTPYKIGENKEEKKIVLTDKQKGIINSILLNKNQTYLLHGITGSGKTEIYMNIISDALNSGKTAIMLVPEISLTPQVLDNFRRRFGDKVAIIHSGLSAGERFDEWKRIKMGEASIVVGARSAIFMPLENIGVIIIDEEHEQSYNSESHPRFITSEVAEFRRKENECTLVLGSATPSMVSYHKAITGEYQLLELKERVNGQKMPPIHIVDMCNEIRLGNPGIFSNALKSALSDCIKHGNQAILFINRRGYSSFIMCKECGWVAKCPDCDVSLALHTSDNALKCHYCANKFKIFSECPECGNKNLKKGSLGTERVEEELYNLFDGVKVLRMDNDTTRGKDGHLKIIEKFKKGEANILVGTQMVAKGHDFPAVTVVGIIDPDLGLYHSSFASAEKTFALVSQVAGRAGRADKSGVVILQSYSPNHYVYKMAQGYDYLSFYRKEIGIREITCFPPFATIVRVLFSSLDETLAINALKAYYSKIEELKSIKGGFIYLNKMRSPVSRIMNKFRFQIVMRLENDKSDEIIDEIFSLDKDLKISGVQTFIEVNAQDLR